ncbi:MAG: CcoQ/FixQ family Cbb3-type cytochrome c oxidase assembly chaperone [Robiginitomaculum sp.]|nr:MAG: CcoQ/FixQ family Cbb3-type cytochrome c oxidase assembly chaperone [Robiginitomaculum sp.]
MDYDDVAKFAQTWGLVYFAVLFALVLLYALWPGNQKNFDEAANIPLNDGPLENGEDQ